MKDSDRKRFSNIMHALAEYYAKAVSVPTVELYWRGLQSFDMDDVERAAAAHMQNPDTGQFMPKVADIIRYIDGGSMTRAMQAFAKVERAVRHIGTYESVVFDDRIIHAVIADMGGWILLGQCKESEWPFKAREFEKRYQGYLTTGLRHYPGKLIGMSERENGLTGFDAAQPVLIGDSEKALAVAQEGAAGGALEFSRGQNVNVALTNARLLGSKHHERAVSDVEGTGAGVHERVRTEAPGRSSGSHAHQESDAA